MSFCSNVSSSFWTTDPSQRVKLRLGENNAALEKPQTLIELFLSTLEHFGNHRALAVKRVGEWRFWTYEDYYRDCITAAKGFIAVCKNGEMTH